MASSGFGPYHGQWHVDAPTMCIGAIPTPWFGLTPSTTQVVGSVLAEKGGGSVENEGVRVEEH